VPPVFWDYVFSAAAVLWVVLGCYAVWRYIELYKTAGGKHSSWQSLRSIFMFMVSILLISLIASHIHLNRGGDKGGAATSTARTTTATTTVEEVPRHSHFKWESAVVTAVVLGGIVVGLGIWRLVKRQDDVKRRRAAASALADLLDETVDDLRAEPDPRTAVIAAYARMERAVGAYGLPRVPSEAPTEYLRRMLVELAVSKASARRLTELFERAKFSSHEVDAPMKEDAIDALIAIRDELRPGE
jgi:hypothetical protein